MHRSWKWMFEGTVFENKAEAQKAAGEGKVQRVLVVHE